MDFDDERNERERRYEDALERLGTRDPKCQFCTERRPVALMRLSDGIACYECLARHEGGEEVERHHVMGQHNDPFTVPVPINDHRVLSDCQIDWHHNTLRNPQSSPIRRMSAAIRGWLDVLWLIIYHAVGWIPDALENLDNWLLQRIGERWWEEWDWQGP